MQQRTLLRAIEHSLALPCLFGRRTVSRMVCALDRQQQDWSADYKLYSRSKWNKDSLFDPVVDEYKNQFDRGPITVAFDDTKISKTGKKIPGVSWHRDPLSPPFHVNFLFGLRFIQASMIFPHYQQGEYDPRAIPIRFHESPVLKKPGKRGTEQQWAEYRTMQKKNNLSVHTVAVMRAVRTSLDCHGAADRLLICALDGSFCNKTIFKSDLKRTVLVARCRKDARLCFPAPAGGRRKYDPRTFTPEQVRQDEKIPWKRASLWFGGARRRIRYKEVRGVFWRRGAGQRLLRLIVIAPQPYRLSPRSRVHYRQPAYLLATDTSCSIKVLLQAAFDRWQIEVNHRDEKSILGVGQAQVRSEKSVPRHPTFAVAIYSMLLLASLKAFGPGRTNDYVPIPKWRKKARRPSLLDILTLLRKEINETRISGLKNLDFAQNLTNFAYT